MATVKYKIESGVQLLARLIKKPVIENFYPNIFQPGLKHDDVIEICSSNNSKYLLVDIICEALLPSKTKEAPVGVVVFNTDGQLNYKELIMALKRKIVLQTDTNVASDIDSILLRNLSNLFILNIYDATQFYTTIYSLDSVLTKHQNISLLIFDTLTAFYWSEQGFKITKMDFYIKNLLRMIQKVSKEYKVIIIYTRPEYFSSSKDSSNLEIGEVQMAEGVNFKVQLTDNNSTGAYQVNIRTSNSYYQKYMTILDNEIKWQ